MQFYAIYEKKIVQQNLLCDINNSENNFAYFNQSSIKHLYKTDKIKEPPSA